MQVWANEVLSQGSSATDVLHQSIQKEQRKATDLKVAKMS